MRKAGEKDPGEKFTGRRCPGPGLSCNVSHPDLAHLLCIHMGVFMWGTVYTDVCVYTSECVCMCTCAKDICQAST